MVYGGVYRGLVSGGAAGGRVQVSFPWLDSDQTLWAAICSPPGSRARYQTGQEVFIMFERGDFNRPVVVGAAAPGG